MTNKTQKVLIAGSTGYLGQHLIKEFKQQGYWVRALCRNKDKLNHLKTEIDHIVQAEATKPDSLKGICKDIDLVVSSLGITRQKDRLTYMDVDYQGNKNILDEALKENVKSFMYISVLNGQNLRHLKGVSAKETFCDDLKKAKIDHYIIRPNGFFSDMSEFFQMAKKGRVYLFADGQYKCNPIHGEDLARFCAETLQEKSGEFDVGGPEIMTQNQIARTALKIARQQIKITHLPLWIIKPILFLLRTLTPVHLYGPMEFFLTVMTMDMVAPTYGDKTLAEHFKTLRDEH